MGPSFGVGGTVDGLGAAGAGDGDGDGDGLADGLGAAEDGLGAAEVGGADGLGAAGRVGGREVTAAVLGATGDSGFCDLLADGGAVTIAVIDVGFDVTFIDLVADREPRYSPVPGCGASPCTGL